MDRVFYTKVGHRARSMTLELAPGRVPAVDLTGKTAALNIWNPLTGVVIASGISCAVVNATAPAQIRYDFRTQDVAEAGNFSAEVVVTTTASGQTEVFPSADEDNIVISIDQGKP